MDAIEPSDARTSFAELARASRSIAQSLQAARSDRAFFGHAAIRHAAEFQRSAAERGRPPGAACRSIKQAPNFTVENVVAPRRVYDAKKQRVLATIAGFGTKKADRVVSLVLNGRVVETKTVDGSGERARHGRVSFARRAARAEQGRGADRFGGRAAARRPFLLFDRARRAAPRAVRPRGRTTRAGCSISRPRWRLPDRSAFIIDSASPEQVANVSPDKIRVRGSFRCGRAAGRV